MRQIASNHIATTGRSEVKPLPSLGFSRQERSQYSIVRALRNFLLHAEGKKTEIGLELEAHSAIEKLTGKSSQGLLIPVGDLQWEKRSVMQAGQAELGGNLVGVELRSSDFVRALRNKALILRLGAKFYEDLVGNVDFPKVTETSTGYWLSEGESLPESNLSVSLVTLRPRTIGSIVPVTRRLLMQSSGDAEAIVREDLISTIALGFDQAAISGTGINNEPLGILNYPGVNSVSIGANGGALTWNHIVQLETEVSVDNADDGNCYYLTNATTRGKMKTTQKVAGQAVFLWEDSLNPAFGLQGESRSIGFVNGYAGFCSNQMPSDGTKGSGSNLSSLIFGNFSQLMLANWGILELLPNQYGAGFPSGVIEIRAMLDADIAIRHAESFSAITDIVTT